jgi:hypothetical protein
MANIVDKVIKVASNEVGYLEKKSNAQLNNKTANAGSANYTKYGEWFGLNPDLWCAMFLCWIFNIAYGTSVAKQLLCGSFSAACETIRQNFISKRQYYTSNPQIGDVVFFKGTRHSGANHIGLVINVSGGKIYTIEGNTSGGSTVIDNGGGVAQKSYAISYNRILGYGRPNYDKTSSVETIKQESKPTSTASGSNSLVRDGQIHSNNFANCGITVDGIYGNETKKAGVKVLQQALNLDYKSNLIVDGIFGAKSNKALGNHYVKRGETQFMVTALEILLMLKKYNPNGVECPGTFGSGLEKAVTSYKESHGLSKNKIADSDTFKSLIN